MATKSGILSLIEGKERHFKAEVLDRQAAISRAYTFSEQRLAQVRQQVADLHPPSDIWTQAVAGSLARFEACEESDLDLIIVTSRTLDQSDTQIDNIKSWRDKLCEQAGIPKPNPKGVFHNPIHCDELITIAGRSEEHYDNVAKRMLFLLESKSIYQENNYGNTLNDIVDAYAEDIKRDPKKNFVFLLNDVVRFFRALCVNYQFNKSDTADGKWPIRNIKLRHSRVLMYFSLIAAIGTLSRCYDSEKIEALKSLIQMEPLKRLYVSYAVAGDPGFFKVAGYYNTFLYLLSQPCIRTDLSGLEYEKRYELPVFSQLKANSDALSSELLRFYEARRQQWDGRFFEYMIL